MKLLIVKTSSMGDVIHTFPAVTDAVANLPGLQIDWCVEEGFADLPGLHPAVANIHQVAIRRWRGSLTSGRTRSEILALRRRLRDGAYDLVIDAQGLLKSALVARLSDAPVAGYDRHSAREGAASLFYRRKAHVTKNLHAVERTRALFAGLLGYPTPATQAVFGIAAPDASRYLPGYRDVAVLLHGTSWETKKWSAESWVEVALRLSARGIAPLVTYGNASERAVADTICAAVPQAVLVPKTRLSEMAAVLGRARLAIGADSGLTHLASAFGIPTVSLFFASRPGLTGPVGRMTRILESPVNCSGCGKQACARAGREGQPPCRAGITPDDVMAAAGAFLPPADGKSDQA